MEGNVLCLNNKKVFDFYKEHTNLGFEEMNVLFVDILNKMFVEISPNMDSGFACKVMNEMKDLNLNMNKLHNDNACAFNLKFAEFKKDYQTDIKLILNNNNQDCIKPLLSEYNQILQDKTKILLNEIVPKNNEKITNEINTSFGEINKTVMEIKSINMESNNKVGEVLKKFENSSLKGAISEQITYNLIRTMYAENQIQYVGSTKESGDIIITRNEQPKILIENKDYKAKVDQVEVDKFIKDLKTQNCSGILLSQNSGILNKKQFDIKFYGNNIGIYISFVEYDTDKIQIGINMIDEIKVRIPEIDLTNDTIHIDNVDLEIINKEFNIFVAQKLKHIKSIKDWSKKLISETEEINIPTLYQVLNMYYGSNTPQFICKICGYVGKNQGSLAAHHKKTCKNIEENNLNNLNNLNIQ